PFVSDTLFVASLKQLQLKSIKLIELYRPSRFIYVMLTGGEMDQTQCFSQGQQFIFMPDCFRQIIVECISVEYFSDNFVECFRMHHPAHCIFQTETAGGLIDQTLSVYLQFMSVKFTGKPDCCTHWQLILQVGLVKEDDFDMHTIYFHQNCKPIFPASEICECRLCPDSTG